MTAAIEWNKLGELLWVAPLAGLVRERKVSMDAALAKASDADTMRKYLDVGRPTGMPPASAWR